MKALGWLIMFLATGPIVLWPELPWITAVPLALVWSYGYYLSDVAIFWDRWTGQRSH